MISAEAEATAQRHTNHLSDLYKWSYCSGALFIVEHCTGKYYLSHFKKGRKVQGVPRTQFYREL
jgi:hypothetical protein